MLFIFSILHQTTTQGGGMALFYWLFNTFYKIKIPALPQRSGLMYPFFYFCMLKLIFIQYFNEPDNEFINFLSNLQGF